MKTLANVGVIDRLEVGSCWKLLNHINGYEASESSVLSTQAAAGRCFKVLCMNGIKKCCVSNQKRIKIKLFEDGYECWCDLSKLLGNIFLVDQWEPNLLTSCEIKSRLPNVLKWIQNAFRISSKYYWGGTIGPNFDCSGLVQAAFASQEIWLPRDAYQQERFCEKIEVSLDDLTNLEPCDLLFFGSQEKCTHVAIHINNGLYWHSSGISKGQDGIGINGLGFASKDHISAHYKAHFRSAGRVVNCFNPGRVVNHFQRGFFI